MKYFFTVFLFILIFAKPVSAQQNLQVQGLGVDPFLIELEMEPGQTLQRAIKITNTTNTSLSFNPTVNDFMVESGTGQPLFLNSNEKNDERYSLSNWITVKNLSSLTVPAYSQIEVSFNISPPKNAEPGTHYGGILFGQKSQVDGSGSAVEHKAGVIILVNLGKAEQQVKVENFSASQKFYKTSEVEFITGLYNLGNVHLRPKGEVTIRNIFGRSVSQVPINRDASIILPDQLRNFTSNFNPSFAFGRYTAEAIIFYGDPKIELRANTVFWVIPVKQIIIGLSGIILLGIMLYLLIKSYNRYIIKKNLDEFKKN